jgi:glucose dehydrogenase
MNTKPEYDVVIVGAGVSGALVAYKLAAAGIKVVVLEAGPETVHPSHNAPNYYAANTKTPDAPWPVEQWADGTPAGRPSVLQTQLNDTKNYMIQRGPNAINSSYERVGGGTTMHWLGTCLRLVPKDLKLKSTYLNDTPEAKYARDWPITYDDLEPWYGQAEHEIGVSGDGKVWDRYLGAYRKQPYPMPPIKKSYLDQQYTQKLDGKIINDKTVGVLSTPQGRNSVFRDGRYPCLGNSSCVPICPIQAKYDATVHIRKAKDRSIVKVAAEFRYESVAYRVEVDENDDVRKIHYKDYSGGENNVEDKVVSGKVYVLCAHAIETPKLLLISPWGKEINGKTVKTVANRSDQVGRNLMDHIIYLCWALTAEPVYPLRGPLSTSGISAYRDGPERKEQAAYIIEIGNDGWVWPDGAPFKTVLDVMNHLAGKGRQWYGEQLKQAVHDHIVCQVRLASEMEALPLPDSRVFVSGQIGADGSFDNVPDDEKDALGIPKPQINYRISEYTKRGFVHSIDTLKQILTELGIQGGVINDNVVRPEDKDYDKFKKEHKAGQHPEFFKHDNKFYQYRGAGHIIGTYRMGDDPDDSVVDKECRCHDHRNLFLLGDGVFPSTATANPTLTIAALALRAAETITKELGEVVT